jgi:hypothetical protein
MTANGHWPGSAIALNQTVKDLIDRAKIEKRHTAICHKLEYPHTRQRVAFILWKMLFHWKSCL